MKAPPAKQLAAYIRARDEYVAGTGTKNAMVAKVTPGVAELLSQAETAALNRARDERAREELLRLDRRHRRREMAGVVLFLVVMATAAFTLIFALTTQIRPHYAAQGPPPQPALVTQYTGSGMLTLDNEDGTRDVFHVQTVIEQTNGMMTKLPIEYVDDAGDMHFYTGMFHLTPDPEGQ